MRPGIADIEGAQQFALDFRTRVGSTNYVDTNAAKTLSFAYSTQNYLLNDGRFSAGYFATQLDRMRDAYLRYAAPARATSIEPAAARRTRVAIAAPLPQRTASVLQHQSLSPFLVQEDLTGANR
jgi:hypothetical protein